MQLGLSGSLVPQKETGGEGGERERGENKGRREKEKGRGKGEKRGRRAEGGRENRRLQFTFHLTPAYNLSLKQFQNLTFHHILWSKSSIQRSSS